MSMRQLSLLTAPVPCALLCIGELQQFAARAARQTASGLPACELCGRQLGKVKHKHKHGAGHACHPRCKPLRSATPSSAAPAAATAASSPAPSPPRKRKHRADSDPGQQSEHTVGRLRVRATRPLGPDKKKQKQEKEAAISALLDAAHARRVAAMALLEVAGASSSSASTDVPANAK